MYSNPNIERKPLSEINVTPLVDVALTLLIMFIITAPLLQSRIDVNLPTASRSIKDPVKSIIISLTRDKNIYIGKKPIFISNIGKEVADKASEYREYRVLIEGDREVDYGFVIEVMDEIKQAGIEEVGLVIQEKKK